MTPPRQLLPAYLVRNHHDALERRAYGALKYHRELTESKFFHPLQKFSIPSTSSKGAWDVFRP